jgi:hypothetical protein
MSGEFGNRNRQATANIFPLPVRQLASGELPVEPDELAFKLILTAIKCHRCFTYESITLAALGGKTGGRMQIG